MKSMIQHCKCSTIASSTGCVRNIVIMSSDAFENRKDDSEWWQKASNRRQNPGAMCIVVLSTIRQTPLSVGAQQVSFGESASRPLSCWQPASHDVRAVWSGVTRYCLPECPAPVVITTVISITPRLHNNATSSSSSKKLIAMIIPRSPRRSF